MSLELALFGVAVLLAASVMASTVASKLGIPVLLVFLGLGMLAGSDGIGGIWFEDAALAQKVGVVALAFILFSGGMDLDASTARPYLGLSLSLATVGVLVTAGIVGVSCVWLLGFSWLEAMLLGSIVASTDAAAVFSTLARGAVPMREGVRRTLEIESGSNDPMAVFLTTALIGVLTTPSSSLLDMAVGFLVQMPVGAIGGWVLGRLGVWAMRQIALEHGGLYHVLSIVVVLASYSGVALIGGNGFLAVYVAGVAFGNGAFPQRKGLRRFHDGLAWISQIVMFLVLGLLVFPSQLPAVALPAMAVALVLMFVARPLAVLVSVAPLGVPLREQGLLAWCGLRGAVPIVLATFPLLAGLPQAQKMFDIVFFVVLFSALFQGPTIPWVTQRLGLAEIDPTEPQPEASAATPIPS